MIISENNKLNEAKLVKPLSINGISYPSKLIKDQISKNIYNAPNNHVANKSTEELLSMTRTYSNQIKELINKLNSIKSVLDTYNKSQHTLSDINDLYKSL